MTHDCRELLWLDVETTGLDPHDHYLLQVAGMVTDYDGNQLSDEFEYVVHYSEQEIAEKLLPVATDYVLSMHCRTGLWHRLPDGVPPPVIDQAILEVLRRIEPEPRRLRLAGNSVRLDANFVDRYLPLTSAHLHYRLVDVSGFEWLMLTRGILDAPYSKRLTHNAIDDIRESLAQYRWLLGALNERTAASSPAL